MRGFVELAEMYGCDKQTRHRYGPLYEQILARYRGSIDPVRILEIGIDQGASLRIWMNYFRTPVIYAIDNKGDCCKAAPSGVTTFCGDQADIKFLKHVIDRSGGAYHVVIDDGGHGMEQQQTSFASLWPEVQPGGVYVIEDLEFSKRPKGQAEAKQKGISTTLDYLFSMIRDQISYRLVRHDRPLWTFCGEMVAIRKPT